MAPASASSASTSISSHSCKLIRLSHLPFQAPVGVECFFGHRPSAPEAAAPNQVLPACVDTIGASFPATSHDHLTTQNTSTHLKAGINLVKTIRRVTERITPTGPQHAGFQKASGINNHAAIHPKLVTSAACSIGSLAASHSGRKLNSVNSSKFLGRLCTKKEAPLAWLESGYLDLFLLVVNPVSRDKVPRWFLVVRHVCAFTAFLPNPKRCFLRQSVVQGLSFG